MKEKETVRLGKIFERLRSNPDYCELYKLSMKRVEEITTGMIDPRVLLKSNEDLVDNAFLKGELAGLNEGDVLMQMHIKLMKEDEVRKKAKEKENARHSK